MFKNWVETTKHYSPVFQNVEDIKVYLKENSQELFQILQGKMVRRKQRDLFLFYIV
jgi:hypothetical protein